MKDPAAMKHSIVFIFRRYAMISVLVLIPANAFV